MTTLQGYLECMKELRKGVEEKAERNIAILAGMDLPKWAKLYEPSFTGLDRIRVDIPFDEKKFVFFRKHILGSDWTRVSDIKSYLGARKTVFENGTGVSLELFRDTSLAGSSCRLVKTGEETITEDIYEIRCDQNPEELVELVDHE